jgi:phage N-6-adenine-methyltransferase
VEGGEVGLTRFRARNHPQQTGDRGPDALIDDRATMPEWFAELNDRFNFTIDVAASAHNTKCSRFYDIAQNGLAQSWAGERVWCNPPFSDIRPWVTKAWGERSHAELIVMLVPANRTEQAWWQDHIEPFRDQGGPLSVEFIRNRRRFIRVGESGVLPNDRPPFGVCLLIWETPSAAVRCG